MLLFHQTHSYTHSTSMCRSHGIPYSALHTVFFFFSTKPQTSPSPTITLCRPACRSLQACNWTWNCVCVCAYECERALFLLHTKEMLSAIFFFPIQIITLQLLTASGYLKIMWEMIFINWTCSLIALDPLLHTPSSILLPSRGDQLIKRKQFLNQSWGKDIKHQTCVLTHTHTCICRLPRLWPQ